MKSNVPRVLDQTVAREDGLQKDVRKVIRHLVRRHSTSATSIVDGLFWDKEEVRGRGWAGEVEMRRRQGEGEGVTRKGGSEDVVVVRELAEDGEGSLWVVVFRVG